MTALTPYMPTMGSAAAQTGWEARAPFSSRSAAEDLYRKVSTRAWLGCFWARLTGRPQHLPALAERAAQGQVTGRHDAGTQTVPVAAILGSENRSRDFDPDFRPLNPNNSDRWESVARALLSGARLPPVELIRVGDAYFVRDGHHRVSAARALGQRDVDAAVTVWELASGRQ